MTTRRTLYFTAPGQVEVREESLDGPGPGQMLVETLVSAISPGTEMLIYRGQFPQDLPVDETIPSLGGAFCYPLAYGYSTVGRVVETGPQVEKAWRDRLVFSFQPHTSHFLAMPESVLPLPENIPVETACFLPNMETAVNLVQDAAPILGERVMVFGQGIIGLLTASLLAEFPLAALVSADRFPCRRQASLALGAASLDPEAPDFLAAAHQALGEKADLCLELSGAPAALDDAIHLTVFSGRVVIGSWYGQKRTALDLGGSFHRSRIRLISSQVSSIAPELSARWDKARRFEVAWRALKRICPEKWITQRFPLAQAARAYQQLDQSPAETIQVVFDYSAG